MSKARTVEEFFKGINKHEDYLNIARAFAKMHVIEASKEILENIPCLGSSTDIPSYEEVKDAVLTAYPLENIK